MNNTRSGLFVIGGGPVSSRFIGDNLTFNVSDSEEDDSAGEQDRADLLLLQADNDSVQFDKAPPPAASSPATGKQQQPSRTSSPVPQSSATTEQALAPPHSSSSSSSAAATVTFDDARLQLKTNCKEIKRMFSEKFNQLNPYLSDAALGGKVVQAWNRGEEHLFDIINYVNQVMQLVNSTPACNNKKLVESIRTLRRKSASPAYVAQLENEIQDKRSELKELQKQKRELDEEGKKITLKKDHAAQRQKKRLQLEQLEQSIAKDFDCTKLKAQTEANLAELKQVEADFRAQEERLQAALAAMPALPALKRDITEAQQELKRILRETEDWERKTNEVKAKTSSYVAMGEEAAAALERENECAICLEAKEGNVVEFSPCTGHSICRNCWMSEAKKPPPNAFENCPICRRRVTKVVGTNFACTINKDRTITFTKGKLDA